MDWVPWVIRAVLIVVGIIVVIKIWKGKKRFSFRFLALGITIFILGVILLLVSLITDLSLFYGLYLTAVGAIAVIIGLVIRNIWEKNR
jgi:hypothetical protein